MMTPTFAANRYTAPPMSRILGHDDLRTIAPSIFATTPYHQMSGKYRMVPTIEVVGMLHDRGFEPVRAQQSTSRIEGKGDFTKHMIRFRHQDFLGMTREVGGECPELVLTNSHDGTSAYKLMAGIFRLVCLNGLTVQSAEFGSIAVRHSGGKDFESRILEATSEVSEMGPRTMDQIAGWKQVALDGPRREIFAEAALELKENRPITPAQVLKPRRAEDQAANVWTTFNVVQENMVKGGLRGVSTTGTRTTTRPVKSVNEDLRLNRALWLLAERMAQIAG